MDTVNGKGRMMKITLSCLIAVLLVAVLSGCGTNPTPSQTPILPTATSIPVLVSTAFTHEKAIPQKYTCDGEDISPPLQWNDPSESVQSFALILDDPDAPAGTWVHWILYNIPDDVRALSEAIPSDPDLADGSQHGKNSWGRFGYGGPCPPTGTHRYFFKLYELDSILDLATGASKEELLQAMEGHILNQLELMGTYSR